MPRKTVYHPHSWSQYNKNLVNRGSLTLWISEELLNIYGMNLKKQDNEEPLNTILMQRFCVLTKLDSFINCLFGQLKAFSAPYLNFSKLGIQCLAIPRSAVASKKYHKIPHSSQKEPKELVLDSPGLKVYGEGEWKVHQHGLSKRRTWRKIHLGFDAKTQEIVCATLTTND